MTKKQSIIKKRLKVYLTSGITCTIYYNSEIEEDFTDEVDLCGEFGLYLGNWDCAEYKLEWSFFNGEQHLHTGRGGIKIPKEIILAWDWLGDCE